MKRRAGMWVLAVIVVVLVIGGVVGGVPGFSGSDSEPQGSQGGSLNVTEFAVLNSSCNGDAYSGLVVTRGNVVEEHRTNYSIIGTIPVRENNVSAGPPGVITLADSYVLNVTSSAIHAEPSGKLCEAYYRMNYTIPYGGADDHTVTTLHNGRFVAQENNVKFENGSIANSGYGTGISGYYNMSA